MKMQRRFARFSLQFRIRERSRKDRVKELLNVPSTPFSTLLKIKTATKLFILFVKFLY